MKTMRPFLFLIALLYTSQLAAQNINTVFRSKMTFPNETLANCWHYAADGKEYALLGAAKGLIIVDVTNPDAPQQIVQIPGPNNLWKEIKTYQHYAYIVSEGGQGIQIVNLNNLPSPNLAFKYYKGNGAVNNQLNKIHALHIDLTKGFLYAWGGDLFGGGAKIFNLNPDPYNPTYVGKYDNLNYIHDGFVDNDMMYAAHIYSGFFSIVNMANKNMPVLLNTQSTPDNFTHNTWLTDDRKTLLTTDERTNTFLAAYDVSDPDNIRFLDKIQSNPGSQSIVHNTHIRNDFAITSWYKDGFTIVDVSRPANLVQVGNHDTYAGSGNGFEGCWGVDPFLPSGTIIASNINAAGTSNGEMWLVTPNYVRACHLEGIIRDVDTQLPLFNVNVKLLNSTVNLQTNINGEFKHGQLQSGYYTLEVTAPGFQTYTTTVFLQNGELTYLEIDLFPIKDILISGRVSRSHDKTPVIHAAVDLYGEATPGTAFTDNEGRFTLPIVKSGYYQLAVSHPGAGMALLQNLVFTRDTTLEIELYRNYRRDEITALDALVEDVSWTASPNPFSGEVTISRNMAGKSFHLTAYDATFRIIDAQDIPGSQLSVAFGTNWPPGNYRLSLSAQDSATQTLWVVKTN